VCLIFFSKVFGTQEHDLHRRRRAAISSLYSKRSINNAQALIEERVEQLCANLAQQATGEAVDLHHASLAFTTDTVAMHSMGKTRGLQESFEQARVWKSTIYSLAEMTQIVRKFPRLVTLSMEIPETVVQTIAPKLLMVVKVYKVSLLLFFFFFFFSPIRIHSNKIFFFKRML
jgi:cytochrome P450